MSHRFDGTWTYYQIAETGFNPGPPSREGDFVLVIDDTGKVDAPRSNVDGRKVLSGKASVKTLEIVAEGRKYYGHIIKEIISSSQSILVMAGRHKDVQAVPSNSKASGKGAKTNAQDEGTWVLTKP